MSISLIILIITSVVSVMAFRHPEMLEKGIFHPVAIWQRNEWYRFLTNGLLHAGWLHLIINMYVLWIFGTIAETAFTQTFSLFGRPLYLAMYLLAIPISTTYSYVKHRHNYYYKSLGASGAVSAVLFSAILFYPLLPIYVFPLPFGVPAFIFGPLYLAYCVYMARHARDHIGHDAHFLGAVFGFCFPLLFQINLLYQFWGQILNFHF